jgi:SAM-dependent methyltransferase
VLHLSEKELQGKSLLYFAPNWGMLNWLKRVPGLITRTTDLLDSSVDFKADICDLPMKVESYDFIICSHVLEHVPDDKKAISELCRVLKFGGIALVQFPYDDAAEKTDEDPLVEDPAERKKRWGQFDHVRLYGQDVRSRFEEAGFQVSLRRPYREIGQDKGLRYGLWDDVLFELIKVGEAP